MDLTSTDDTAGETAMEDDDMDDFFILSPFTLGEVLINKGGLE
jgi:hypothetical protein